jgi:very-long-chain (3R)-3-hydroxyacyl-CoA dehydratase
VCRIGNLQMSLNLYCLLLAWSITEVIRYPFYAFKELTDVPYILTWLRYTTFIVLYPLGVASELAMVWLALPELKRTGLWSAPMPNVVNFDFHYYAFCMLAMLAYAPGSPQALSMLCCKPTSQTRSDHCGATRIC